MLELEHISVIGLSETKIHKLQSKFIYKHLTNFTTYFDNDSVSPMGSGVGIIISNDYNKYIHRHKGYKGRVYHVDLFMKGYVKMRIIQTYLHATIVNNRKDIEDIHSYIFQLLESAEMTIITLFLWAILMYNMKNTNATTTEKVLSI